MRSLMAENDLVCCEIHCKIYLLTISKKLRPNRELTHKKSEIRESKAFYW